MSESTTSPPTVAQAREYLRSLLSTTPSPKTSETASASPSASSLPNWLNRTVYDFVFGNASSSSSTSSSSSASSSSAPSLASTSSASSELESSASDPSNSSLSDLVVKMSSAVGSDSVSAASSEFASNANSASSESVFNTSTARPHGKGFGKKSHKSIEQVPANMTSDAPSSPLEWDAKQASVSERASRVSVGHIIAYFLLFVILSILTVWLVNWFMRRRQRNADVSRADEEMVGFAPRGGVDADAEGSTTKVEVPSQPSSSVSRGADGNSSRQRFLQSRREAAQRSYGATEQNDPDKL